VDITLHAQLVDDDLSRSFGAKHLGGNLWRSASNAL
jgi:hypothetical protein